MDSQSDDNKTECRVKNIGIENQLEFSIHSYSRNIMNLDHSTIDPLKKNYIFPQNQIKNHMTVIQYNELQLLGSSIQNESSSEINSDTDKTLKVNKQIVIDSKSSKDYCDNLDLLWKNQSDLPKYNTLQNTETEGPRQILKFAEQQPTLDLEKNDNINNNTKDKIIEDNNNVNQYNNNNQFLFEEQQQQQQKQPNRDQKQISEYQIEKLKEYLKVVKITALFKNINSKKSENPLQINSNTNQYGKVYNNKNNKKEKQNNQEIISKPENKYVYIDTPHILFQLKDPNFEIKRPILPTFEEYQNRQEKIMNEQKNQSKFYNQNKNLLSKIMKYFCVTNLKQMEMPVLLFRKLVNTVEKIKDQGRTKIKGKIMKSDQYNHSHYNLIFLTLNKKTVEKLINKQQNIEMHQEVYQIDLKVLHNDYYSNNDENNSDNDDDQQQQNKETKKEEEEQQKVKSNGQKRSNSNTSRNQQQENSRQQKSLFKQINEVNFFKWCFFNIALMYAKPDLVGNFEDLQFREYEYRTFNSIEKLNQGIYLSRF